MASHRTSGILLHISSLPGPFGIGDLGPAAYAFADFLAETRQRLWQVLPLVPVGHGYSPYSSPSTFAGNTLFISPELLVEEGLVDVSVLRSAPSFPADRVDYPAVEQFKRDLLEKAFKTFESGSSAMDPEDFEAFCRTHSFWLEDYALYMTLKRAHADRAWTDWPRPLALRDEEALRDARDHYAQKIRQHQFAQYVFYVQWGRLKAYCEARDIRFFGDVPIYVAHDSADVWANPELFFLEDDGQPSVVAGVPPDYFSETGQRWGNPIYRWDLMRQNGFDWWTRRIQSTLDHVDLLRLDHFRGFAGYWEIPASEETAVNGHWADGPGATLFEHVGERLGQLPLVAEDLGLITDDVKELMAQFGFPGMAVIQFAFDESPDHIFLPHNFASNLVAYTGTHDNDTIVGWWNERLEAEGGNEDVARANDYAREYVGLNSTQEDVHWAFVRMMLSSVAETVVTPLQDVLGLGSEARMNVPGLEGGNWSWRYEEGALTDDVADRLRTLTETYGR